MTKKSVTPDDARRVNVGLFIVHPTLDPREISAELGLEPAFSHRVGEERLVPSGRPYSHTYRDTRWKHYSRHLLTDQWFCDQISGYVRPLNAHKSFFDELIRSGGSASIIVQFLGDGYHGDRLSLETMAMMVDLGLSLEIEVFDVPQR